MATEDVTSKCRHVTGVALLACATVALSLYYLAAAEDNRLRLPITISDSHDQYLVRGQKCLIQDVDPYNAEVKAFVKHVPHIPCAKTPPLTYLLKRGSHSELKIDKAAIHLYSPNGVNCCYSTITRAPDPKKPDDTISISDCKPFKNSINITDEFVLVKCATKHRKKEVYKNAHAAVHVRKEVLTRLEESSSRDPPGTKPLSVLMVGVDSISRLNALRTLPLTTSFLRSHNWTELRGYNKIADNTYPNLMAVLTGIDGDAAYEACLPTELYRLDNCSFIWRKYREHGYTTAYAEDEATISTFNFLKVGFVKPPTDYYLRPFVIAAQRELKTVEKHSLKYCVGPVPAGERILRYAQDFAVTFVNRSSFGLFWTNSFSHNDLNSPSGMDGVLLKFFKTLHESTVTQGSIVVFFSDHGMRFGDVRQTKTGWLEERLPFAWISVPGWFKEKFSSEWEALQQNSGRLTTPYDLHMTLQHVLVLAGRAKESSPSSGCPNCHSLFVPMDINRSCEDVSISPHWCVCTAFKAVSSKSSTVKEAAKYVVDRVTAYVHEGAAAIAESAPHKCAKLTLSRIIISEEGKSWDGQTVYYLLFVETLPGRGRFEATVSVETSNATAPSFKLHSSISRLDTYAGQSRCINNAFLKKYCYCR